jgi:hypothetical protein
MTAALDPLGSPPVASNDYISAVTVPWGVMGNDDVGDCTIADCGHSLMLRTANNGQIVVPTTQQILDLYSNLSGWSPSNPSSDNGLDESTVCAYMVSTGLLGHKADATGSVDPWNFDHLKWCIQLFGSCRIGLNFPAYAVDLFDAGKVWDISTTGDQSTDGHDVPLVDYRNGYFTCVSWGKLQMMTPAFLNHYIEEAHSELYFDWIKSQGEAPSGFSLIDLTAKLQQVI